MHSDPVYLSTQLYIYTSPPSCVLTNIKANMQVLCLKYFKIIKKTFGPILAYYSSYEFKS